MNEPLARAAACLTPPKIGNLRAVADERRWPLRPLLRDGSVGPLNVNGISDRQGVEDGGDELDEGRSVPTLVFERKRRNDPDFQAKPPRSPAR